MLQPKKQKLSENWVSCGGHYVVQLRIADRSSQYFRIFRLIFTTLQESSLSILKRWFWIIPLGQFTQFNVLLWSILLLSSPSQGSTLRPDFSAIMFSSSELSWLFQALSLQCFGLSILLLLTGCCLIVIPFTFCISLIGC